jgi:hypothetical protein
VQLSKCLCVLILAACKSDPANMTVADEAGPPPVEDSGVDAAPPVLPVALVPPAGALPLDAASMLPVATGDPMDYDGTLVEDTSTGTIAVLFSRFLSQQTFLAEVRMAHADASGKFGASEHVGFSADPIVAGPRALVRGDEPFVYFMHGDQAKNKSRLARARFTNGAFETPTDLTLADSFAGMFAWPSPALRGDGVVLAYDHYGSSQYGALGDGKSFGAATRYGGGVQGRVASMADGTLVATWQNGIDPSQISYVRISTDGVTWTPDQQLTTKLNVHDVSPFRRADGGVDIYYISSDSASGFRIIRRAAHADATLGPEEIVTSDAAGSFTQPHPHRLHDGTIGLVFAKQVTSNVDTDTYLARIASDGPP